MECSGHICPQCRRKFSHTILNGEVCLDMKGILRHCEDCQTGQLTLPLVDPVDVG